jgi:hypothetical protein
MPAQLGTAGFTPFESSLLDFYGVERRICNSGVCPNPMREVAMPHYRIDFESMPWDGLAAGARAKACDWCGKRLRLLELTEEFVETEWCSSGHAGYVLDGRLEVEFDDGKVTFGPRDGILIPAGEAHRHKGRAVAGPVKLVLLEEV